jgi:hypothetical protein
MPAILSKQLFAIQLPARNLNGPTPFCPNGFKPFDNWPGN